MFATWVDAGGNLIAMRPDADLAGAARPDRCRGRPSERLPPGRHRAAPGRRHRRPDDPVPRHRRPLRPRTGAESLATLYSTRSTATANPAVTLRSVGRTAARRRRSPTTSRARSSTRARATRRGPARSATASSRRSRSDDLSSRTGSTSRKVQIPQADEQQRLLANLIEHVNRDADAAAALLVLPARREGGRRHDRRRSRQRRHRRPVRPVQVASQPGGLRRRRLGVRARHLVHLPEHAAQRRAGRGLRGPGLRGRAAYQHRLRRLDAGSARRLSSTTSWRVRRRVSRASPRRRPTAPTASRGATGRRSRRSSSTTASAWTRTTTTGRRLGPGPPRACSPAPACRCASPTSTAR